MMQVLSEQRCVSFCVCVHGVEIGEVTENASRNEVSI